MRKNITFSTLVLLIFFLLIFHTSCEDSISQLPIDPIDGGFTDWFPLTVCSKTCGSGYQYYTRSCTNPPPKYNGKSCEGAQEKRENCNLGECPEDNRGSIWGKWSSWSQCANQCPFGYKVRNRTCSHGTDRSPCSGRSKEKKVCSSHCSNNDQNQMFSLNNDQNQMFSLNNDQNQMFSYQLSNMVMQSNVSMVLESRSERDDRLNHIVIGASSLAGFVVVGIVACLCIRRCKRKDNGAYIEGLESDTKQGKIYKAANRWLFGAKKKQLQSEYSEYYENAYDIADGNKAGSIHSDGDYDYDYDRSIINYSMDTENVKDSKLKHEDTQLSHGEYYVAELGISVSRTSEHPSWHDSIDRDVKDQSIKGSGNSNVMPELQQQSTEIAKDENETKSSERENNDNDYYYYDYQIAPNGNESMLKSTDMDDKKEDRAPEENNVSFDDSSSPQGKKRSIADIHESNDDTKAHKYFKQGTTDDYDYGYSDYTAAFSDRPSAGQDEEDSSSSSDDNTNASEDYVDYTTMFRSQTTVESSSNSSVTSAEPSISTLAPVERKPVNHKSL